MTNHSSLPRVCLIYTGGTIGMTRVGDVLKPPSDPSNFLQIAPELGELVDLDFVQLLNKDSTNITPNDWTLMASTIYDRMIPDCPYEGFVVAHGTDTMHFSASALSFAFGPNLNVPIVFTGAQTDASVFHGDARVNLVRAMKVALEDIAAVVISFGDFVFRGCRTQKRDERHFNAFESPAFYPIADITERILIHPIAQKRLDLPRPMDFRPNFDSEIVEVSLIPGLKPNMIKPILDDSKCEGVILLSFGAGNVPDSDEYAFDSFIEEAVSKQIPVIVASQFPANSTLDTAYEPGIKAINAGAIPTGNMTNAAATAKFRWVLARVRSEILSGELQADRKLAVIKDLMSRPYVDEMDVAGNALRQTWQ